MQNLKRPGTSSTSQPTDPVLLYHQGQAENTKGPTVLDNSADEDSEKGDEKSAQSRDSERTLYCPDLYVLTNDEHWTMTPGRIISLRDCRQWRSTGHMQIDHYAMCTTIIVPQ